MANLIRYSAPLATRWPAVDDLLTTLFEPATNRWTESAIRLEVSETPEAYLVKAELPGVAKDQITVNAQDNDLTISVEFKQENQTNGTVLMSERVYGKASRSIRLPQAVDNASAEAKHVDGVLQLTLPKRAAAGRTRISVN
jgi:HSP20 family protein